MQIELKKFFRIFIEEKLGAKYKENRRIPFTESYTETGPNIPVFFILSPGVDPLLEVESLGKKLGFTQENGKFHNISLGQGQDVVASAALDIAAREGRFESRCSLCLLMANET